MHAPMWVHHYLDALGYVHAHCYVRVRHYVRVHHYGAHTAMCVHHGVRTIVGVSVHH